MATETKTQAQEDAQAVMNHAFKGKPLDPQVAQRVHEQAVAIRAKLPRTNIAVDLIREIRDEE